MHCRSPLWQARSCTHSCRFRVPAQVPCEAQPDAEGCTDQILRFVVESKGAVMLQLVFSKMVLCPACSVMIYPMDPELQDKALLFR